MKAATLTTTVLLIRHGDRYDYHVGKDVWKTRCKSSGGFLTPSDTPLSASGHQQARETAAFIARNKNIDAVVCSPYLRALQTAQPLAHASGRSLWVDFAFAESHQKPTALPPLAARVPYFPEIDESYQPMMPSVVVDDADGAEPGIEPRLEHMRRMLHVARTLPRHPSLAGKTVAVVTHGASLALVAALMGTTSLAAAGKMAACGIYELRLETVSDGSAAPVAKLVSSGEDASAYLSARAGGTVAWGFADSNEPLESTEALWQEALRLGPTDLTKLSPKLSSWEPQLTPTAGGQDDSYAPESLVGGR